MSNVTQTSRDAYYSLDNKALLDTLRGRVAAEIRRLTKAGRGAYISLVAHNLGCERGTISARFDELTYGPDKDKKNPVIVPFQVGKAWFKMQPAGTHLKPDPRDPIKQKRVQTWAIIDCEAPAEQTSLFV